MFWNKRPTVDADEEAWLIECWRWLDGVLGPIDGEPRREPILPGRRFFPDTNAKGPAKALHYFERVQHYCGTADWPCELVEQDERRAVALGLAVERPDTPAPAGTFQAGADKVIITYDPALLDDPIQLVATLVHEMAHYLLAAVPDEPPGGADLMEPATDLATVHLGFGLFGANAAFNFRQFTDFDRQGWSASRLGYLGEDAWAYANALFFELLDVPETFYADYAKAAVAAKVRKNRAYFRARPEIAAGLRRTPVSVAVERIARRQ